MARSTSRSHLTATRSTRHAQPEFQFRKTGSAANDNDVWFVKAGIKRTFMPAGATVLGVSGVSITTSSLAFWQPGRRRDPSGAFPNQGNTFCLASLPVGVVQSGPNKGSALVNRSYVTGSEVQRYGIGVVQEIDPPPCVSSLAGST